MWSTRFAVCVLPLALALPAQGADPKHLSGGEFAEEVGTLQRLAQACAADASACDSAKVPQVQQVRGGPGSFTVSWRWLQEAVSSAKSAETDSRVETMRAVQVHLAQLQQEAKEAGGGEARNKAEFSKARAAADTALARDEFRAADGPGWFQRQLARVQDAIFRLFAGIGKLGDKSPWLAPLIEWSCFGLAAAGLLWSVRQSLARQALRLSLGDAAVRAESGTMEAADWARTAEERAAAQDWREAIHCLYWAAIAFMEGRRAWKPNVTRTPREYLGLLKPGSEAQRALNDLTAGFERVWYGHGKAGEEQYRAALGQYRALEAAKPERSMYEEAIAPMPLASAGTP